MKKRLDVGLEMIGPFERDAPPCPRCEAPAFPLMELWCQQPRLRDSDWRGTDYIGSEKRILRRCIRERGIVLTPEAQARLDAMPEKFRDFLIERGDLSPPAFQSPSGKFMKDSNNE